MANNIQHTTNTKTQYPGFGVPTASQSLSSSDWDAVHAILAAGNGIQITSDGATPPTFTFTAGGGTTSFGGNLVPSQDATYDIGQVSPTLLRWRTGYFSSTISAGKFWANVIRDGVGFQLYNTQDGILSGSINQGSTIGGHINDMLISSPGVMIFQSGFDTTTGVFRFYDPTLANLLTINAGTQDNPTVRGMEPIPTNLWDLGNTTVNHVWRSAYFGTDVNIWDGTLIRSSFALAISAGTGFQTNSTLPLVMATDGAGAYYQFRSNTTDFLFERAGVAALFDYTRATNVFAFPGSVTVSAGSGFKTNTVNAFIVGNGFGLTWNGALTVDGGNNLFLKSTNGSVLVATENNFLPQSDNGQDAGSTTQRWRNVFTLIVDPGATNLSLKAGASSDIIATFATVGQAFRPSTDNSVDIGNLNNRWRNAYFAGAVSAGAVVLQAQTGLTTLIGGALSILSVAGSPAWVGTQNAGIFQDTLSAPTTQWFAGLRSDITSSLTGKDFLLFRNAGSGIVVTNTQMSAGGGFQTNAPFSLTANAIDILSNGTAVFETISGFDILLRPSSTDTGGAIRPFVADSNKKDLGSINAIWRSIYFGTTLSGGSAILGGITNNGGAFNATGSGTWSVEAVLGFFRFRQTGASAYQGAPLEWYGNTSQDFLNIRNAGSGKALFVVQGSSFFQGDIKGLSNSGSGVVGFFYDSTALTVSAGSGFQTNATTSLTGGSDLTFVSQSGFTRIRNTALVDQVVFDFVNSRIYPNTSNSIDLGIQSANLWKNGYFGSALSAGTGYQTNAFPIMRWGVSPTTSVGIGTPFIVGFDKRTGLVAADTGVVTLFTTTAASQLYRLSGRVLTTTGTSATYRLRWTEGAATITHDLAVTLLDTDIDFEALIQPDTGTNVTAQLTAVSASTVNVASTLERMA